MTTRKELLKALDDVYEDEDMFASGRKNAGFYLLVDFINQQTQDEEKIPYLQRPQENIYE